jgi:hypothetical protein
LFASPDAIGIVLDEAGVPRARIQLHAAPTEAWHAALTEAQHLNRTEAIVVVARRHYPAHARLADAANLYLRTRRQGAAQTEGRLPPDVGATPATPEPDRGTILTTFAAASVTLLNWPTTLDDGRWIERPELQQMAATLGAGKGTTRTLLLGPPGSGKSALLARCGQSASDRGVAVLAIKADRLPATVNSQSELASSLGLPAAPGTCVRIIARDQPVLLLLDQLDALAELLDLRSELD